MAESKQCDLFLYLRRDARLGRLYIFCYQHDDHISDVTIGGTELHFFLKNKGDSALFSSFLREGAGISFTFSKKELTRGD